jgi:hypothetical protein
MNSDGDPSTRAHQFEKALLNRVGRQVRNLQVVFDGGGVVLRGQASTYYAKQVAQHVIGELTGLPILANDIEVVRGAGSGVRRQESARRSVPRLLPLDP